VLFLFVDTGCLSGGTGIKKIRCKHNRHVLDKATKEHLPYITLALKGTTIGTVTDATGHYFLKNLPEGNFVLEVSAVGYKTVKRNVSLKKGRTLEEDFEIEEDLVALDGVVISANRSETTREWRLRWSTWLILRCLKRPTGHAVAGT
jgi:hypothetical protein